MRLTTVFVLAFLGVLASCSLLGHRMAQQAAEIREQNIDCLRRLVHTQTASDTVALLIAQPQCAQVLHILAERKP